MKKTDHKLSEKRHSLVEVVDQQGQPLLFMSHEVVLRQSLRHKLVVSAVFAKGKLLFHKYYVSPKTMVFDLFASPVCRGESLEDASIRAFREKTGCEQEALMVCDGSAPYDVASVQVYLIKGRLPLHLHAESFALKHELLALDRDELLGLCTDSPEMFTAHVLWAVKNPRLFSL